MQLSKIFYNIVNLKYFQLYNGGFTILVCCLLLRNNYNLL